MSFVHVRLVRTNSFKMAIKLSMNGGNCRALHDYVESLMVLSCSFSFRHTQTSTVLSLPGHAKWTTFPSPT